MLEITLSFICSLCHSFWYDSKAKSMFLCSLSLYVSCSFLSYPTHLSYYCCFVFSCLFIIGLFEIVKMSREAEERICSASDSEQKAECYEQAFDGRERPFAEASLPFGLREWVYETSNQHCESPFCLNHCNVMTGWFKVWFCPWELFNDWVLFCVYCVSIGNRDDHRQRLWICGREWSATSAAKPNTSASPTWC